MRLDRSYFALQAHFAKRIALIEQMPLTEAFRRHTAFYALARDNDVGVAEQADFDPEHPAWRRFADAVEAGVDPVDYIYADYLAGDAEADPPDRCFSFPYWPDLRLVRLHFTNDASGTGLRKEAVSKRQAELAHAFAVVAREHPDAASVRGASWLYHVDRYRSLFPPRYIETLTSIGHPHQYAALWAQFIDRFGVVKPALARRFVPAIDDAADAASLDRAFPFDVLAAETSIAVFYEHFGVGMPAVRAAPSA